jgi:hypothetical protein
MASSHLKMPVRQLEKQLGESSARKAEEGARAWAGFCLQFGLADASADLDTLTESFVKAGITFESILQEVNGTTRGLLRDDEKVTVWD